MEVFPKDILLRIGPSMLAKYQSLVVMGAGRGRARPVPYTFTRADALTCATYIDRDGVLRLSAANKVRIEWVDLDGDGIRETPGMLLEGSRANILIRSGALDDAAWSKIASTVTPNVTSLGSTSLDRLEDTSAVSFGRVESTTFNFGSDGTKAFQFVAKYDGHPRSQGEIINTVTLGRPARIDIFWNADGTIASTSPAEGATLGDSRLLKIVRLASGAYRFLLQGFNIVSANSHRVRLFATGENGGAAGDLGSTIFGAVQVEDAPFPSSYIETAGAAVTRAADSFTVPFNFGPMDMTVLPKMARPVWADITPGGLNIPIVEMGPAGQRISLYRNVGAAPSIGLRAFVDTPTTDAESQAATPAGAEIAPCAQFRNFSSGPQSQIDTGSGFSGFSGAASIMASFGNQTLYVGTRSAGDSQLYGVILDLPIYRGLFSRAEALAAVAA